jgi:D-serine deaminase-like pyridoxal phosphate-dependent protein
MKRRTLILGGAAAAIGGAALLRPSDRGGAHNNYFLSMQNALDRAGLSGPTLVIDRALLAENVQTLTGHIGGRFDYRIVAKSLPSLALLKEVMALSGSSRLMLFHQPFINQVARELPQADILLGKPMPVQAASNFYDEFSGGGFDPSRQLAWLLDTPERLDQYRELGEQSGQSLRICIELDVGLHRGGIDDDSSLLAMLAMCRESPALNFAGFMGYEPHVVKVPGDAISYRDRAMARYQHFLRLTREYLGDEFPNEPLLNAGGSPTYQLYDQGDFPFNELAAGSCLVKPTDFDLPSLSDHLPASYIATPVLKSLDTLQIPGIDLGPLQSMWDPNRARTFFTYGGYWKAIPESPPGLSYNALFGRSTNQEMLNGSRAVSLAPDDWIFLRPTQSEFVFLQFGDIAVYDEGAITERWPVFEAGTS